MPVRFLRLQSGWECRLGEEGVRLHSSVLGKSLLVRCRTASRKGLWEGLIRRLQYGVQAVSLPGSLAKLGSLSLADARKIVTELIESDVLTRAPRQLPPSAAIPEDRLFDRQVRFLNSFETSEASGKTFQSRLQRARVVIVGVGGYGSWLLLALSRMGVGEVICLDPDVVEVSNLDRQVAYSTTDIGKVKVDAALEFIRASGLPTKVTAVAKRIDTPRSLLPFLRGVDLVFNSFGFFAPPYPRGNPARAISQACLLERVPMLSLGGAWVGPLWLPGKSPCYFCFERALATKGAWGLSPANRAPLAQKRMFLPVVGTTALAAVSEATLFLSGARRPDTISAINRLPWFAADAANSIRVLDLPANQRCGRCRFAKAHPK